jgi:antitoxin component of RelBE/YafQ-DinJ toxin-antitoxin module
MANVKEIKKEVRIQVCITNELKNKFQELCEKKGLGMSTQITLLINDFIKNNN